MRYLTEAELDAELEKSRDTAMPEGQINPYPLAIVLSAWLWLGIWLVARVIAG